MSTKNPSTTLLLVHGAYHGAWCWEPLVPHLEQAGYRVIAFDLPGRGRDSKWGWRYQLRDHAVAVARSAHAWGSVVAIGHSMGGQVISAAAEAQPDAFQRLIYISALLPRDGNSMADLGKLGDMSELARSIRIDWMRGRIELLPEHARSSLYSDCSDEQFDWAKGRFFAEPLRPTAKKLRLTDDRFGRIPRSYIRCTQDRALPIDMQDRMLELQPCENVTQLDAGHMAMISDPAGLTTAIDECIASR